MLDFQPMLIVILIILVILFGGGDYIGPESDTTAVTALA